LSKALVNKLAEHFKVGPVASVLRDYPGLFKDKGVKGVKGRRFIRSFSLSSLADQTAHAATERFDGTARAAAQMRLSGSALLVLDGGCLAGTIDPCNTVNTL
jgi:hypothetical protein